MRIREASAGLEHTAGLGRLARRSGGGAAAVVLAGLAVYTARRSGIAAVTVARRIDGISTVIHLEVRPDQDFRSITTRVGGLLRQARPGTPPAGTPTAAQGADGWRVGLPEAELSVFTGFFAELTSNPDRAIGRFDLTCDAASKQIYRSGTVRALDPGATTLTGFDAAVRRAPEAIALTCGAESVSYGALDDRVHRLAHWLIGRGVGPDTVVGVAIPRSIEAIVAVYAVLRAGGAFLPLDPTHPAERLERILRIARPLLVLSTCAVEFEHELVRHLEHVPMDPPSAAYRPPLVRRDQLAYLMFTSGSTGLPKGVAVPHAAVVNHLLWMTAHLGLDATDTVLQKTPVTFDVSIWELLWPLHIGARLAIAAPGAEHDPAELSRALADYAVTTVQFVPSTLTGQLNVAPDFPGCLRRVLLIGETLTPALAQRFAAASPARLHNLYGPTEATGAATGYPVSTADAAIPIGGPAWNTGAYVLDACLRPVPDDAYGELYLSGIQLARGYFGDPARTADRFVASPFEPGRRLYRTGDIVRWNGASGLLDYQGRADLQVKRHGVRIELGEIEAALAACTTVVQAAAILRADGRLIGYVVPVAAAVCTEDLLLEQLSSTLPIAMIPDEILVLDSFPRNPAGKLDRAALPAPALQAAAYRAPRTDTEQALAEVFAQILGRDRIGVDESFFTLGGDSVMSILLVSRAKARGLHFTAQQVFEARTVAGLAAIAGTGPVAPDLLAELPGGGVGEIPLTPAILALLEQAEAGAVAIDRYAQHLVLDLPPGITEAQLRTVLGAVIARHDMLRARFYRDASGRWRLFADPVGPDLDAVLTQAAQLPGASPAQAAATIEAATEDAISRLDPAAGRVLHCVQVRRTGPADRLIVVVHHLAIDGVSWRILIPDLLTAWAGVSAGAQPELPAGGTSLRRWAHSLREAARQPDRIAELERWQALSADVAPLTDRPVDPRIDTAATLERVAVELDAATTTTVLSTLADRYRTDANTVLLTAVALAVAVWRDRRGVAQAATTVELESHGRDPDLAPGADLSHTIGWFTAAFPARLDLADIDIDHAFADGPALATALKTVKEQLLSVPGSGIGYGLLRYLNPETARHLPAETGHLSFTYLGTVSDTTATGGAWLPTDFATPGPLREPVGTEAIRQHEAAAPGAAFDAAEPPADSALADHEPTSAAAQRNSGLPARSAISVDALVSGGQLRAGFTFPRTLLRSEQVRELADLWVRALTALARHAGEPGSGGRTPSDFAVPLRQPEIEAWEQRYPGLQDIWGLTPIQAKFAELAPSDPGGTEVHTLQVILTCTGTPDVVRLRSAAQRLVDRHAALRAAFRRDGDGAWRQLVTASAPLSVREVDLRSNPDGAGELLTAEQFRPFDLAVPPLLRLLLIRTADHRWTLALTNHRLLLDGWSAPILLRELLAGYAADDLGATEIEDGFGTFLRWRATRDQAAADAAWHTALHDLDGPTLVATPGAAPAEPVRSAAEQVVTLSAAQTRGLSRLATAAGVTLNTVFQYVWAQTLAELTGRDDILFGTVVSGRPPALAGIDEMVGSFINTVPVRVRPQPGELADRLRAVQAAQAEVLEHHHLGLADIESAAQRPIREFFDTLLVFESYPAHGTMLPLTLGELTLAELASREITLFPLTATVWPRAELRIALNWHRDLIDDERMARLVGHLTGLLDALSNRNGL
ncbi:amino acid adenylation domain-containing protein [Nocardia sp. NPDC127579]|uniref:amino acid adenylation domain-containing protein n=1 Tax=Nocardia sp. NPDC127579 TaxID=3345402 RepID=UPI00363CD3AE